MTARLDYGRAAPAALAALDRVYAYVRACGLPRRLVDLAYLRTSQINGCAYCIDLHTRDLREGGMEVTTLMLVGIWREAAALFAPEEQAALAWAESITLVARTGVPDVDYAAVRAVFDDRELADLTVAIGLMNAFNRLAIAFRRAPGGAERPGPAG